MVIKMMSLKLSWCTLTLLQRPDWYDRFVVSACSRAQVPESYWPDFKCRYLSISIRDNIRVGR